MSEVVYHEPDWFTKHIFNPLVCRSAQAGSQRPGLADAGGARPKRAGRCGPIRSIPSSSNGRTYLLAPRGTTQWVRNMRVAKEGELRSGRKVRHFTAEEVPDSEKLPLMRLYMDKWVLGGEGLPRHRRQGVRRGDRADHAGQPGVRS